MGAYRADWPTTLAERLARVRAEAAAYRAKLAAARAADPLLAGIFGALPDAHLARLEAEASDLEYVMQRRAAAAQAAA